MPTARTIDAIDAKILVALTEDPRATVLALASKSNLSRNTVQTRLAKMDANGVLRNFDRSVDPAAAGYPLTAFVFTRVAQQSLAQIASALEAIPEVIEVHGLSGQTDLLIHVVAQGADDLYRTAGRILGIDGVEQTNTALAMRKLVDYRVTPLLAPLAAQR
ncbi:Lrp/AsnC family transcriptional regulator [Gordonia humi]|uniref:DNA-binding Lrp family transcriptional regulator n=1 Tax=Gordonia humi TaxID=686429 RepID=A0A840F5Q9_9ACTN|nr:Lrp/AsnC family transcriptional regulator [Gordonia humi]MBB4137758.1 DNA-binding Lrp family transcriptional regulator [Gordonia humi]